jgi:hypothetical protein
MAIINWKEEMLKRREALNPLKSIKSPSIKKGDIVSDLLHMQILNRICLCDAVACPG